MMPNTIKVGNTVLTKGEDGFYRDTEGTIWSVPNGQSKDASTACGVGIHLGGDCYMHDHAYESDIYQATHTRSEADGMLYRCLRLQSFSKVKAGVYWAASRIFGSLFWENKKTRDK